MEDRILADLRKSYGITVRQFTPVTGGLLNLKWKASTDQGDLLVKQYSTRRFRREQIERIESALERQIILEKEGVPCPMIWKNDGHILRWLDDETVYMVMAFHAGKTENAETITIGQLRSLGSACTVMHNAFSLLPEPSDKRLPGFGGYTMDALWQNYNARRAECTPDMPMEYQEALHMQEKILRQLDASFFHTFPKGFAHEDCHAGNILFHADRLSAIVDFDRNCYSYVWHDIGRALLSFALDSNGMNVAKVRAFLDGYALHAPLALPDIAQALRLSWCIETPWFIQPGYFEPDCNETGKRLKDEVLWLTENWFNLEEQV